MWAWYDIYDLKKMKVNQKELEVDLESIGKQNILITKANFYTVIFKGVALTPKLNGRNGFEKDGVSAYIDEDNHLWVGVNEN